MHYLKKSIVDLLTQQCNDTLRVLAHLVNKASQRIESGNRKALFIPSESLHSKIGDSIDEKYWIKVYKYPIGY